MADSDPPAPAPGLAVEPAPVAAPTPAPAPAPAPAASEPVALADAPTSAPTSVSASTSTADTLAPLPLTPTPALATPTAALSPAVVAPVVAAAHYGPAPVVHHLTTAPAPYRPSTLPQQLRRLAYIVSLALGGGAVLAGVWSAFLLPLLHATFSARTALLAPQRERWRSLLDRLREIRAAPIFRERVQEVEEEERALVRARTRESEVSREELALVKSRSREEKDEDKDKEKGTEGGDKEEEEEPPTVNMFADVAPLSAALRDLASSLDATATTRTSLVSTLEGYTSGLHRELFARGGATNSWGGTSSVGLSTLGANLAKAGGSADASPLGLPAAKSEEWDNVRREVRAIKGLLLNRRNFSVPARSVAA